MQETHMNQGNPTQNTQSTQQPKETIQQESQEIGKVDEEGTSPKSALSSIKQFMNNMIDNREQGFKEKIQNLVPDLKNKRMSKEHILKYITYMGLGLLILMLVQTAMLLVKVSRKIHSCQFKREGYKRACATRLILNYAKKAYMKSLPMEERKDGKQSSTDHNPSTPWLYWQQYVYKFALKITTIGCRNGCDLCEENNEEEKVKDMNVCEYVKKYLRMHSRLEHPWLVFKDCEKCNID